MAAAIEPQDAARFALLRYLRLKADQIVEAVWPIIHRLAAMLLAEPRITGERIKSAIWECLKAENPALAKLDLNHPLPRAMT